MKAILIEMFGGPECLVIKDIPTPTPKLGQVLVKVKAFGVNHAEMHMRKGEWAESMPVSGIECVGIVAACPGQEFKKGTPVAALMGGLGRTINGTYAEYTCAPVSNVVSLGSTPPLMLPPWHELAAIPESYATAWTCLFRNLELKKDQKLLIRGATSALGQAALNLAASVGAYVTATTRNLGRSQYLKDLGASRVEKEGPGLSQRLREVDGTKFDAILELIGNSTLLDSLTLVRRSGRICLAGFLGGLEPISDFNPLLQMASGVHFSFFGSFVFGTAEFPLSDVPLGDIVRMVVEGKIKAKPSRIFKFEEISEAHRVMEANEATGKMVLTSKVIEYLHNVNDASKDNAPCAIEASNLYNLLVNLRFRLEEGCSNEPWYAAVRALAIQDGPLDQYKQALEQLQAKVIVGRRMKKISNAIMWKFSKEEVSSILSRMERLKTLVQIALEMDQFKLSRAIKDDTSFVRQSVPTLQTEVNALQHNQNRQRHHTIMDWIFSTDFPAQQFDLIVRRQEGTSQWFLNSPKFTKWLRGLKQTLFCPGIPGVGKTMMAAITIDHLLGTVQSNTIEAPMYTATTKRKQTRPPPVYLPSS